MRFPAVLLCLVSCSLATISFAEDIEVVVTAERPGDGDVSTVPIGDAPGVRYGETGQFLRDIPGVNAGRMGGHGLEPVIDGQQQTQLNVTSDGAFVHGGCPNRMDPPTASLNYSLYDRLLVNRGYQTVQDGPGGSGGSLRFERDLPEVGFNSHASSQYVTNGSSTTALADSGYRNDNYFLRASGAFSDAGNYTDGNGNLVRSAYRQYSGILDTGVAASASDYTRFTFQTAETLDALFPGAGMDSPSTNLLAPRFDTVISTGNESIRSVSLSGYVSLVDHVMDNYSLRPRDSMFARAPSESDTYGGRLSADTRIGGEPVAIGMDAQYLDRSARRYSNPTDRNHVSMLSSVLWPDTTIADVGVFSELTSDPDSAQQMRAGIRLDTVMVDAGAANETYGMMGMQHSANSLYQKYYGEDFSAATEVNPSGLFTYTVPLASSLEGTAGLSYVSRTADTTERSIASEGSSGTWVGNPNIDPEHHRAVRGGLRWAPSPATVQLSGYYDSIDDFILKDTARGQNGILSSDGATIYRNIGASLSGFDSEASTALAPQLKLTSALSYTYGENRSSNQPLPQIPPLTGWTGIEHETQKAVTGIRWHYASKQNRVDDNPAVGSGRDVGKTGGYGTIDTYVQLQVLTELKLRAGVTNLFDKNYANHLNRANTFEPGEVRVNEPGRSFYVGMEIDL